MEYSDLSDDILKFLEIKLIIPANNFSFLLLNARSIRNKIGNLLLYALANSPDFIFITESWADYQTSHISLMIPGYICFREDRIDSTGGGCIIYSKKELDVAQEYIPLNAPGVDSIWISLKSIHASLLIGLLYSPPRPSPEILEGLSSLFSNLTMTSYNSVLLCGDFNIPNINWITNISNQNKYSELLIAIKQNEWFQLVKNPTRGNNILDLVFSHNLPSVRVVCNSSLPGSDHLSIQGCFEFNPVNTQLGQIISYRSLLTMDWENFRITIRGFDWLDSCITKNVHSSVQTMNNILLTALDLLAPIRFKTIKSHRSSTDEVEIDRITSLEIKRTQKQFRKSKNWVLITNLADKIKEKRKTFMRMRQAEEYISLSSKNPIEDLSKILNKRCPLKSKFPLYIRDEESRWIVEPVAIAEQFNQYFASVLTTDETPLPDLPELSINQFGHVIFDVHDVAKLLSTLKKSRYPGPDGIPSDVYRNCSEDLAPVLAHIYTFSLNTGIFPSTWKCSHIIPHHKSGSRDRVENYRPIHHTVITSRPMER
ncbi:MAG: endonuclease/exonuclease/phosphatase family protein, partial [Aeromonas sp.]